jgi:hypothetical protein
MLHQTLQPTGSVTTQPVVAFVLASAAIGQVTAIVAWLTVTSRIGVCGGVRCDASLAPHSHLQVCEVTLLSGVTRVSLTARQPYKAVASLISTSPVLVDLNSRELVQIPSIDFKGTCSAGNAWMATP